MSAYIVDKNHILYLLAAMSSMGHETGFSYFYISRRERVTVNIHDSAELAEIGNLLWRENMVSIAHRYSDRSSATWPGPIGGDFQILPEDIGCNCWDNINPAQVIKSCDCLEHQSCEHDSWVTSETHDVIQALRQMAWHSLPGYDAAIWGAPEPRKTASLNL